MTSNKAESYVIIGAGLLGLFVVYKLWSTGQAAANTVSNTIDSISNLAGNVADTAVRAVNTTTATFSEILPALVGQAPYPATALESSLTMADAANQARTVDRWYEQYYAVADDVTENPIKYGVPFPYWRN